MHVEARTYLLLAGLVLLLTLTFLVLLAGSLVLALHCRLSRRCWLTFVSVVGVFRLILDADGAVVRADH